MDVPDSGAVFTLGKSYLAENTQSYFYIKNDPIKRLISGPHQSAVICESGRLFVWGENQYGQLGIGGISTGKGGHSVQNGDIVTKPTCVKALKTLGLKTADIAYGNNWAVILTYSNELFFSGRNIFGNEARVSQNFTEASVANETYAIIRKPFRLEEFDDCLSSSEETENFVTVLAGNEHFAVMTSLGRLIGWGSNRSHQLGGSGGGGAAGGGSMGQDSDNSSDDSSDENLLQPIEILLDAPVRQFACGPESTLVLTESGNLFITGRLNDLVFTEFVLLQKNLSSAEQIIFIYISKASEIFIVTDAGSIFRSTESVRSKSLIFQRFYDYDSEENGPIWKLLKGSSFFAVLTKANKFYTTFSESGHHLKTFREITKFKYLRLLDIAVGDQHILVHGVPRSSTLSATMGPGGEHRFMSRTYVLPSAIANGGSANHSKNINNNNGSNKINQNSSSTSEEQKNNNEGGEAPKEMAPPAGAAKNEEEKNSEVNGNAAALDSEANVEKTPKDDGPKSPSAESIKSRKSPNAVKFDVAGSSAKTTSSISSEKLLRPRTPYPESSGNSTPQTIKKTPLRNFSYEAAMNEEYLERVTPPKGVGLDEIPETLGNEGDATAPVTATASALSAIPFPEEDEELRVEISTTGDENDPTIVVNKIRFINNGVDVTANVAENHLESESEDEDTEDRKENVDGTIGRMKDSVSEAIKTTTAKTVVKLEAGIVDNVKDMKKQTEEELTKAVDKVKDMKDQTQDELTKAVDKVKDIKKQTEEELSEAVDKVKDMKKQTEEELSEAVDKVKDMKNQTEKNLTEAVDNVESKVKDASESVESTTKNIARDAVDAVGENVKRVASDARQAVEHVGQGALKVASDARQAVDNAFNKVTSEAKSAVDAVTSKISNEVQEAKDNLTTLLQPKSNATTTHDDDADDEPSNKDNACDDERTTASVNSNHTSSAGGGNPFENGNPFEGTANSFANNLDENYERGKQMLRDDVHTLERKEEETKGRMRQFFDDVRAKGKSISCRNEKSVQIEDEPPRYSVSDELSSNGRAGAGGGTNDQTASKVCTIL